MSTQERIEHNATVENLSTFVSEYEGDDDAHFELIEGEIVEMHPPGAQHGYLAVKLARIFDSHVTKNRLGIVTVETGYIIRRAGFKDSVLAPDIAFTSQYKSSSVLPEGYIPFAPDLAIEIKSPNDTIKKLRRKTRIYLTGGTQIVLNVYPFEGVEVCRPSDGRSVNIEFIEMDGSLEIEDVLPNFQLAVKDIFYEPDNEPS